MSVPLQLAYTCSLATVSIAAAGRVEASRSAEACAKLRSALGAQSEINISVTSCAQSKLLDVPVQRIYSPQCWGCSFAFPVACCNALHVRACHAVCT